MFAGRRLLLAVVAIASTLIVDGALGQTRSLDSLRERYAKITSVHLRSSAVVKRISDRPGDPPLNGNVRLEYWANSHGYRTSCSSDASLGLVGDMEWAFDGSLWQLLEMANAKLVLSTHAPRYSPVACPNALFLLVEFLGDRQPGCGAMCVELADLRETAGEVVSSRSSHGVDEYSIRGQGAPGSAATFLLTVDVTTADPRSLVRFYPSGRKAAEFSAVKFSPTAVGPLPTTIQGRSFQDNSTGTLIDTATFAVERLEINRPIDEHLFQIDWASAKSVYDADAEKFLVHPNHQ